MKRRTRAVRWAVRSVMGVGGLLVLACGATSPADLSCQGNRDCLDSEICHPDTSQCVALCTTKNDCPGQEEERVCEALSATNSTRICKCLVELCLPTTNQAGKSTIGHSGGFAATPDRDRERASSTFSGPT